ncbi:MAG: hypothetical protein ACK5JT_05585 [Hyphomicrobiaceae bacterium]
MSSPPNSSLHAPPATDAAKPTRRRPDIANRRLIGTAFALGLVILFYFMFLPLLPAALSSAGSPPVYLMGLAGTALLLVAAVFVFVKRTGRGGSPVGWFMAHVGCGLVGFVLVAMHTTGKFDRAPALMLLNLLALLVLGIWARIAAARRMADTFGTKLRAFTAPDPAHRATLEKIIAAKTVLLARLDPAAKEATFSVTLPHLLRAPRDAIAYMRLARAEADVMGTRQSVGPAQAWWRGIHLALAALFVAGVAIHVVLVTFFAGYVAGDGPIHWWHITAWRF